MIIHSMGLSLELHEHCGILRDCFGTMNATKEKQQRNQNQVGPVSKAGNVKMQGRR